MSWLNGKDSTADREHQIRLNEKVRASALTLAPAVETA